MRRVRWPAVLLSGLLAILRAEPPPATVSICAFNLRNWLATERFEGRDPLAAAPKPESEREQVVKHLATIKPDVLGVCEIGTREDLADLQARLKSQGLELAHAEFAHGGDPTRSLALLSRFPLTGRHSQTQLHYQIGPLSFPMQRGILDATVEIAPGFALRLIGVHLKSKRPIAEADEALMRRNEAHLLRKHLDGVIAESPSAKVICYGDFNCHRNEPAIAAIIGNRAAPGWMTEIPLTDTNGSVWTHFWDAADVYSRFDYFFVSRALRPMVDSRRSFIHTSRDFHRASDHRPIVLTLKTTPGSLSKK